MAKPLRDIGAHKHERMCATPGCKLSDFHDGPCTTHLVAGKRLKVAPPPTCFSAANMKTACEPEYGTSVSKDMQRLRIAAEMRDFSARKATTPCLVFVASHTGSDLEWFEKQQGKMLPREASLVAVNKGAIAHTPKTKRVVKVEHTRVEDFADAALDDSVTHIWLDLTEQEVSMHLLWNSVRILKTLGNGAAAPEQLFVNLSKRCHTFEASTTIFLAQCSAVGLSVNHIEEYTGVTNEGLPSRKRNMLFFSCAVVAPRVCKGVYNENLNVMGSIVWIDSAACQVCDAMEHGLSNTFVGVASGYASQKSILVRFFGPTGPLRSDKWTVPLDAVKRLGPWSSPPTHRP